MLLILYIKNYSQDAFYNQLYNIESNNSFVEFYQYVKWLIIIGCVIGMALLHKSRGMLIWTGIFIVFLLEDIFRIHEILGTLFFEILTENNQPISEKNATLLAVLFIGFILLMPVIWLYNQSSDKERRMSKKLVYLLVLFLFFAFGMDQIHQIPAIKNNSSWNFVVGIIEDGGELVTESVIVGFLCYSIATFKKG